MFVFDDGMGQMSVIHDIKEGEEALQGSQCRIYDYTTGMYARIKTNGHRII